MMREEQFALVAGLLIEYETGDFLLLSDLSDAVKGLKDFFFGDEEAEALLTLLDRHILEEMNRSGGDRFKERVSNGVDLLQNLLPDLTPEQRQNHIERISAFIKAETAVSRAEESVKMYCDDEALQIFLTEVKDRLDQAQDLILKLEEDLTNRDIIQNLFRIFHTIKGECGFLKIASLGELTHNIENLLDGLRSGKAEASPQHIDLLLEGLDMSGKILKSIASGDFVVFNDIAMDPYYDKLRKVLNDSETNLGTLLVKEGKLNEVEVTRILQKQKESAYVRRFGEIAVKENYLSAEELQNTLGRQKKTKSGEVRAEHVDPVIKVKASKVNFLVDMIGELLITMGQMTENTPAMAQMRKITRSLQRGAMELRTESAQSLFGNVKRVVRDLGKQLEKPIVLEVKGEELEIDRNLMERLEEPLMHLIRNSIDHGIESADERLKAGKDPQGTITLIAERRGNSVVITVRDDGNGLNRELILRKAVEKNLVKADFADSMTDSQVYNLIFTSGFSTADEVTLISGRGVGMDIVRSVVTENRGRIEIDTQRGKYSEFRLVFPLSTAIIDGMIVRVGGNLLILPIASVIESIKIAPGAVTSVNGRVEVLNLRGEAILVLRMHDLLGIDGSGGAAFQIGVVVENSEGRKFLLMVDEVISKREVVIKSLGDRFKNLYGISSGTVLAGGKIGLVLDVDQLVELSLMERV
jgi:two-component system chemotaxis sensor kinase CheA